MESQIFPQNFKTIASVKLTIQGYNALLASYFATLANPPVGDSADRHPVGDFIFVFLLYKNEKIRIILRRIGFENHFFTDFLDPSLLRQTFVS
jgi:hypothetical protein